MFEEGYRITGELKIMYNIEEIEKLAKTVAECNLGKIKIETEDFKLTIEGQSAKSVVVQNVPVSAAAVVSTETSEKSASETEAPEISGNCVKAPIVGTFYSAPAPDQKPFVAVGDTVKKGDVLFIIESMKLMNEVQSDYDGVVEEIFVSNGEAIEYDQPIMCIK